MKKINLFLLMTLMSWQVFSQVNVGTGTISDYTVGPIGCYWGYSYYQIIYRSSAINASGTITGMQFKMANADTINASDDNIDIWLGHTTKSNFETAGTDWFDVSSLTQVLTDGTVTKEGVTLTITFDTPFEYDGVQNLVVAVDANESGYNSMSDQFYRSEYINQELVVTYQTDDDINIDPTNPQEGISSRFYPNVTFLGITQSCLLPSNTEVTNITGSSADISWTENGTANTWKVEYGPKDFVQGAGTIVEVTGTPSINLNNLASITEYDYYVKSKCSSTEESGWIGPYTFTTLCGEIIFPYSTSFLNTPPSCWSEGKGAPFTNGPQITSSSNWMDNCAFTNANGEIIRSNKVNLYNDEHNEWLITPSIDLSGGNYELKTIVAVTDFKYSGTSTAEDSDNMGSDDKVHLLISEDDGNTWTSLYQWNVNNQPLSTGTTHIQNLSAYDSIVKFAIFATDGTFDDLDEDYDFHIGHFEIRNVSSCPVPTLLSALDITSNSAHLAWKENATASNWEVEIGENGFTQGEGTIITSTDTSYAFTNLNSDTDYQFYVRSICSTNDLSEWVGPYNFTTLVSCPAPSLLSINNITTNSANLVWKETASANQWQIEYGDVNFSQGEGTLQIVTDTSYTINNLNATSEYQFYIRSICGDNDSSIWVGPYTFETPCEMQIPYLASFENNPPACWEEAKNGYMESGPSQQGSSKWKNNHAFTDASGNIIPSNTVKLFYTNSSEWLISPSFDLSTGNYELKTIVAVTNYKYSGTSTAADTDNMGSDDKVHLLISEDNGQTWTSIYQWNINNQPSVTGTENIHNLSEYTGEVKFAIWATDGNTDDTESYNFHIGHFEIREPANCIAPSNLSTDNITGTNTDIMWNENGSATNWNIEYGTTGFTQGSGTQVSVTENPYTLTNLTAGTNYQYYIQSICSETDSSQWVGPFNFQTFCTDIITPNYLASFQNNPPLCWEKGTGSLANGPSGTFSEWKNNRSYTHEDGEIIISNKINLYDTSHEDWLITPNFDLSGSNYELNIEVALTDYKNTGNSSNNESDNMGPDDEVQLLISQDNGTIWTNLITWNTNNQPAVTGTSYTINLSNYNGNAKFALYATDGNIEDDEDYDFHIGHFEIITHNTNVCYTPTNLNTTEPTSNSAVLSWAENGQSTSWNIEYGTAGFSQGQGTQITITENPFTLENLNAETMYNFYVQSICDNNNTSEWSNVKTFTTTVTSTECVIPSNLNASNIMGTSATLSWSENGQSTSWNIEYGTAGFSQGQGTQITVTENPFTLENLNTETMYNFYVQSICDNNNTSEWSHVKTFITTVTSTECVIPSNLNASNIMGTSATLSWSENGQSTSWNIEYGTAGFSQGQGTQITITENPFTLENLNSETVYNFYVRSICNNNNQSEWSEVNTFSTVSTGFNFVNQIKNFSYYPNPLKDALTIKAKNIISKVEIYNLNHTLLYEKNFYTKDLKIDFKSWNSGIYIIRIIIDNNVKNFKIIKE